MPLPNTSPDMSPMPTTVSGSVSAFLPSTLAWRRALSHAPRAVIPIALWSYPVRPPEAKASPSQYPYSMEMSLARSLNVAVPLSAATTRYGSSSSWTTVSGGWTTVGPSGPGTRLSVRSSRPRMKA